MPVPDALQQLVTRSAIAVGVLLNADGTDAEYLPLQPLPYPDSTLYALEAEWASRCLRFVGVMAWSDGAIQTHLDALPEVVAARLSRGFQAYLTAYITVPNPQVN
jgi:hypothetical protein